MRLYIAFVYLEDIEIIEDMFKRYDYDGCSKISVVMERITSARERVWVNTVVGREYSVECFVQSDR